MYKFSRGYVVRCVLYVNKHVLMQFLRNEGVSSLEIAQICDHPPSPSQYYVMLVNTYWYCDQSHEVDIINYLVLRTIERVTIKQLIIARNIRSPMIIRPVVNFWWLRQVFVEYR